MGTGPLNAGAIIRDADNADRTLLVNADGSIDVNATVSGGGTSMVDDAVFTPAVTEVTPIAGFCDDTAPDSVSEGDAGAVRMSANRNLYVNLRSGDGSEAGQIVSVQGAGRVTGDVASDSADAGNPVKVGGVATANLAGATMVAAADRVNFMAGLDGVQITRPQCNLEDITRGNASNTDGSSTQVIAAPGAGLRLYITSVTVTNTSAGFAYVELKSGTTVIWTIPCPATGGAHIAFDPPLRLGSNEALNFDPSAATTTLICSANGFTSKT